MGDRIDNLTERVQAVEEKLDHLSASVDERFNAVDAALLEQRQYTEFSSARLEAKMDAGYARLEASDARLEAKMDAGFSRVERKLDQFIDVQLRTNELVDRRLSALEQDRVPGGPP
jgi:hypothetical protein